MILLGGLSFSTDHLLFSSEFSFFFIIIYLFFIRWSVINRPPIDFVRIFFIYLFIIRWSVINRPPIVFVRIFFIIIIIIIIIIYFYFSPFFVPRITQVWFSQFNSILAQS